MITDQLRALLDRAASWPEEWQRRLAELAVELEAEMSNSAYPASVDELQAIDEALSGEIAKVEEIDAAYDTLRRT